MIVWFFYMVEFVCFVAVSCRAARGAPLTAAAWAGVLGKKVADEV